MNDINQVKLTTLPFKSIAVALLLCIFFGPVGVLYSSVLGGIVMMGLGFFLLRAKFMGLFILVWLISCVISVACANRFNKKILHLQF